MRPPLVLRSSALFATIAIAAFGTAPRAHAIDLLGGAAAFFRDKLPLGDINHKYVLNPPKVNDPKIGKSKSFPAALKIVVSAKSTGFPAGIGKIVHDALFPTYPPLTFKVVFGSADTDLLGRGPYANPKSIWYNVFFGYYELLVSKKAWGRPFGYTSGSPDAAIKHEDLVRIGKADWNHFSNELYGVPASVIKPLDVVKMSEVSIGKPKRVLIGTRKWDQVDLSGVRVVGPARSTHDKLDFKDRDKLVGLAWRYAFGTHKRVSSVAKSFAPTNMRARFFISFRAERDSLTGKDVYKTYMFGGTVNEGYPDKAENDRFLGLQMDAVKKIMVKEKNLGFAP